MPLLAYNMTTSAVTLAAGTPAPRLPASASPGVRGAAVNVTTELRGLSAGNYDSLETQREAGTVEYAWTGTPEYDTQGLSVKRDSEDPIVYSGSYSGASSYQNVESDLTLAAGAGRNVPDTSFLAPVMGNVFGTNMTKTGNYVAGIIGHYSADGTQASTYPTGAVLAGIGDGSTTSKGAVVAYIDGDSATTLTGAMFKVMSNNSTAASGADFGVDLQDAAHDGYQAVDRAFYKKAPLRLVDNVVVLTGAGVPVDGTTGDNVAGPGSMYVDITNANLYVQTSLITTPVWKLVTRAA